MSINVIKSCENTFGIQNNDRLMKMTLKDANVRTESRRPKEKEDQQCDLCDLILHKMSQIDIKRTDLWE